MKTPIRLSNISLHTKILWVMMGLILMSVIVMIMRQSLDNTVDQYWNKANIVFEGTTGDKAPEIEVEIADTESKREYGLMFRGQMEWGDGMIFVFDDEMIRSFWMKNTYIPLDMIFVDGSGVVVSVYPGAQPLEEIPISSIKPAKYVIEVSSGWSVESRIVPGIVVKGDLIK